MIADSQVDWDEQWQGEVLVDDGSHRFILVQMGFNLRLLAVPIGEPSGYDFAWCFDRSLGWPVVKALVLSWRPQVEDEPPGWRKRPTSEVRIAPQRDHALPVNRRRCVHGAYLEELSCRSIGCPAWRQIPLSSEGPELP